MAYPKHLRMDTLRRLAFGALAATFNAVGAALADPCRIFILSNLTNNNIIFSLDGVTDHFYLPAGGFKLIDVCTNKVRDDGFFVPQGTIFYARHEAAAAPTAGLVTVEVIHG
jgi:hypothetical protein